MSHSTASSGKIRSFISSLQRLGMNLWMTWIITTGILFVLALIAFFTIEDKGWVADIQYWLAKATDIRWLRRNLPHSVGEEIIALLRGATFIAVVFSLGMHLRIFYFFFSVLRWFFTINSFARIFVLIVGLSTVNAFAYTCYYYDVIYLSTFKEIVGGLRYVWNGVILYCIVTIVVWLFTGRDAGSGSDHYYTPGQSIFTFPRSLRHPNEIKMDKEIEADTRRKNGG